MNEKTLNHENDTQSASEKASPRQSSGALGRGLHILETLTKEAYPLSAAEVATRCDLDVSTAHRLLQTLTDAGYVLREEASKRYLASPKALFPQPLYHPANVIRRAATPSLTALRDELGHTAGFVIFYMGERILAELVPGKDQLAPYYSPWLESPMHASGSGKIMLMELNEGGRKKLMPPPPWKAYTEYTITNERELAADLEIGKKQGYVIARDDYLMGFSVIAAPIRNATNTAVGCFFVTGQTKGFPESEDAKVGRALIQHCNLFAATPELQGMSQLLKLQ